MNKKIFLSLFVSLAFFLQAQADYKLDKAHSSVGFSVTHLVISKVNGNFNKFDADVKYDEKKDQISSLSVNIDPSSIDTQNSKRDNHLKGKDFFNVSKYKKITFQSTDVRKSGTDYTIQGNLTMHGVTKPITIKGTETGRIQDSSVGERIGFQGKATIDRFDFGLKWDKLTEAGNLAVSKEVDIIIDAQIVKR